MPERKKRSRSRDRGSERSYRDRSRDRYRDKDRERRRERDGERHRSNRHDGLDGRHGYRDRDHRDDNRERRRKRGDDYEGSERSARGDITPISTRRDSPAYTSYEPPVEEEPYNPDEPKEDDSEARSVFVSQLAARLTAKDLGYFFEDKLGEGTVMDSRIVTDRLSRRSKGCVAWINTPCNCFLIDFIPLVSVTLSSEQLIL